MSSFVSKKYERILSGFTLKNFILMFIVVLFILAASYAYKKYVAPKINPTYVANEEYTKNSNTSEEAADIYFFYTTWCPHCKKTLPIWNELKNEIGDKQIKGYRINFIEVDCDKEAALAEKFNITGYPTIKLVKGNQTIEYDAKPSKDTLLLFLNSSL